LLSFSSLFLQAVLFSLNPYAASAKRQAIKVQEKRTARKETGSTKKSFVLFLLISSSISPESVWADPMSLLVFAFSVPHGTEAGEAFLGTLLSN
jgi:hypothetical protein